MQVTASEFEFVLSRTALRQGRAIIELEPYGTRVLMTVEMSLLLSLIERLVGRIAPEKDLGAIRGAMSTIHAHIDEDRAERKDAPAAPTLVTLRRAPRAAGGPPPFAPAGQSTQMIVGADDTDDRTILDTAQTLYGAYRLKRVYYSAFSPIPDASAALPLQAPPLVREHRTTLVFVNTRRLAERAATPLAGLAAAAVGGHRAARGQPDQARHVVVRAPGRGGDRGPGAGFRRSCSERSPAEGLRIRTRHSSAPRCGRRSCRCRRSRRTACAHRLCHLR